MHFLTFTKLKPKPEHLEKIISYLKVHPSSSTTELKRNCGMTMTAVKCTLQQLENEGRLILEKQVKPPKLNITLK